GAIQQLPGIGVLVILVFDPGIGIGDVAVEQVLAVFAIGFQIGLLDFLADEFGIGRREFGIDEFKIPLFGVFRHLIALDRLFEHIHQVYGIGGDFGDVVVEGLRQRLVGEAGGDAGHAFVDARRILVFLQGLGLGVGVFQLLAVIDAHLGGEIGILMLLQARHHAEFGEHFERFGGAMGIVEIAARKQLLVDRGFFRHAQAIGNGNDRDAVEKGLVVLVGLEQLPFGFVGMRQDDAAERDRSQRFGADVIAFLRRGQQRVQHLDRRLEHFDEFQKPLIGAAETARERIG